MSSISSCPKCAQQVSIPPFAAPSAQVRCPMCSAEYPLQSALSNLPPMLVLVEAADTASADEDIFARPATATPAMAPLATAPFAAPSPASLDDIDFDDAQSSDDAGSALDEIEFAAPSTSREELDELAAGLAAGDEAEDAGVMNLDTDAAFEDLEPDFGAEDGNTRSDGTLDLSQGAFGGMSDEAEEAELELETELEELDAEASPFEPETVPRNEPKFATGSKAEVAATDAPDLKVKPRKKRREPSMIGNLIGVVGGGAIGLGMGYLILLWIGGAKFDALKLGPMLPGWMLPAEFSQAKNSKPILANNVDQPQAGNTSSVASDADDDDPAADPLPTNVPPLPDDEDSGTGAAADATAATGDSDDPLAIPDLPTDDATGAAVPAIASTTKKPVLPPDEPLETGDDEMPADDAATDEMPADEVATDEAPPEPADTDTADVEPATPGDDEMPADTDVAETTPAEPADDPLEEPTKTDDVPAAEEKPGPRQAQTATVAELGKVTKDVTAVVKQLADPSAAADKDAYGKLLTQFYRKCSHLAFVLNSTADEPGLNEQREAIEQLVLKSMDDEKKFSDIGKVAGKWIAMPLAKRGDQGILIAGTIESVEPAGQLFETKLTLPDGKQVMRLLSDKEPTVAATDRVVVLGSIVEKPSQDLVGYDGAEEAVVWTGIAVALPAK